MPSLLGHPTTSLNKKATGLQSPRSCGAALRGTDMCDQHKRNSRWGSTITTSNEVPGRLAAVGGGRWASVFYLQRGRAWGAVFNLKIYAQIGC